MGERLPEAWMVEWQRNGRVEFPLRRWAFLQFPVGLVLAFAAFTGSRVPGMLDDGNWRYVAYLLIAVYVGAAAMIVWQLVTQRPALVVDRRGLHLGRRRFMAWSEIGGIGFVSGPGWIRQLPIHPKHVWAKNLVLTQHHVNDLSAFRVWLGELLDEYRDPVS
ncbi:hypothetical protein [Kribbella sp. NPDC048915]|uniref:hypothetical protein n=1 Tax=Kribbella sp. NPDC048915 TaxID=3155148 RepID=UPI0033C5D37A